MWFVSWPTEVDLRPLMVGAALAMGFLAGCGLQIVKADEDAAKPDYFTTHVKPIFQANCLRVPDH